MCFPRGKRLLLEPQQEVLIYMYVKIKSSVKAYGGVEVQLYSLTSALDGREWLTSYPSQPLYPWESTSVPTE
jgi:hypothetical protein